MLGEAPPGAGEETLPPLLDLPPHSLDGSAAHPGRAGVIRG